MEIQINDNKIVIFFHKDLNVLSIQEQLKIFEQALNSSKSILLKADEVDKIDAASLQLLVSFIQETKQKKIHYQWDSISTSFLDAADLLGLRQVLDFPEKGDDKNAD